MSPLVHWMVRWPGMSGDGQSFTMTSKDRGWIVAQPGSETGTTISTATGSINAWEQDPGSLNSPDGGAVLQRAVPVTDAAPFATRIAVAAPPADNYQPGTPGFRYWACADALRRASDFWGGLLGAHK